MKSPASILDLSKRTVTKVMKRLNLGCSNCDWNLATCDIHHIQPKSRGGTNDHSNLTYVCPNCHRLAHAGLLTAFVTLDRQIGDRWKDCYFPERAKRQSRPSDHANLGKYMAEKRVVADERARVALERLKTSGIEFGKRGWVKRASVVIGISPQKVGWWFKRYAPDFLEVHDR